MENRFYKVEESGGTFVTGTFFNPVTGEEKTEVLRDYEYEDRRRDNDELYYMEINEEAKIAWMHKHGYICAGDTVFVCKGRKIPVGTIAKVEKRRKIYNKYRQHVADYLVFEDGRATNEDNCILVVDTNAAV